ncbi:MAG: hypothetical protein KME21_14245 [Desmonostoc vinosum HA7617-LM4]|jgi:hypothetical protein|nr:hypothetical protein [Desmonostoc vinosum HA7617-LM4]
MRRRHYPPAYLRYFKARLRYLGQPAFWGTAIFLSVVGLVIWEYSSRLEVASDQKNSQKAAQKPTDTSLSAEDRAIAADIDNLPVLFNDVEQANLSTTLNNPQENTDDKKTKGFIEDAIKKQKSAASDTKSNLGLGINNTPPLEVNNPFVLQADNLLQVGINGGNKSPFLGVNSLTKASEQAALLSTSPSSGIGFTNQTNKNQNPADLNPLQTALNELPSQKLSGFNGVTSTQTNTLGRISNSGATLTPPTNTSPNPTVVPNTGLNMGAGYTPTGANLPENSYGNFNKGQALLNATPVTPPVNSTAPTSITPYTNQIPTQATPTSITPYANQIPTQNFATPIAPGGYGNYGNSGLQQQPTQQPQSNWSPERQQLIREYVGRGYK